SPRSVGPWSPSPSTRVRRGWPGGACHGSMPARPKAAAVTAMAMPGPQRSARRGWGWGRGGARFALAPPGGRPPRGRAGGAPAPGRGPRSPPPRLVAPVSRQAVLEARLLLGADVARELADGPLLRGDRLVPAADLRVRRGHGVGAPRRLVEPIGLLRPCH